MPYVLESLPAGVKFCPTDVEVLRHLDAEIKGRGHPLIHEFITTLDDDICRKHPEKLPGVRRDGKCYYFFHPPPENAYARGTRKRRKVFEENEGLDCRWHVTGNTKYVGNDGGYKRIMVLYTFKKRSKPQKTNWVVHQYHVAPTDDGHPPLVVSKVFYQLQVRKMEDEVVELSGPVTPTSSGVKKEDDDCECLGDLHGVTSPPVSLELSLATPVATVTEVRPVKSVTVVAPVGIGSAKKECDPPPKEREVPLPIREVRTNRSREVVPLQDIVELVSHEITMRVRKSEDGSDPAEESS